MGMKLYNEENIQRIADSIRRNKGSKLPSEYQEVEYIESTGTQWIDTGIAHTVGTYTFKTIATTSIKTTMYLVSIKSNYNALFLQSNNGFWTASEDNISNFQSNDKKTIITTIIDDGNNPQKCMIEYNNIEYEFERPSRTDFSSFNIILLARRSAVQIVDNFIGKIYKIGIKKNNVIVRNFIPCYRKSDNVIGMYDLVNDVFYTNAGTGTFLKGADVQSKFKVSEMPKAIDKISDLFYKYLPINKSAGVCENAVALPIANGNVFGNSKQETTEGYNKLKVNSLTTQTINGITFTPIYNNRGDLLHINVNGTATEKSTYIVRNYKVNDLEVGTYYIKSTENENVLFRLGTNTGSNSSAMVEESYNITSSVTHYYTQYEVTSGATINNLKVYPQICLTSGKPYEPYTGGQASPNPSYPSEVEVIDGFNLFDVETKRHQWITGSGTINPTTEAYVSDYIPCKQGDSFSIKTTMINNETQCEIVWLDKNKNMISRAENSGKSGIYEIKNAIAPENTAFVVGGVYSPNLDAINFETVFIKGTEPKPYLPYGLIALERSGKNKWNRNDIICYANNTNTFIPDTSNSIKIRVRTTCISVEKYKLKINQEYIISGLPSGWNLRGVGLFDSYNGTKLPDSYQTTNQANNSFKLLNDNIKYIYFLFGNDSSTVIANNEFNNANIQLEEGTATPYEPYIEPKLYPINLNGNTMAKVGDIRDKLRIYRSGKVELVKNVGKYVFTGNEYIDLSSINTYGIANFTVIEENANRVIFNSLLSNVSGKCKYLKPQTTGIAVTKDEGFTIQSNGYSFFLRIKSSNISTVEQLKVFLKANDMYLLCPLVTPQTIELPSIEPIETFSGTNIFKLIANLDSDIEIEYVYDIQTALLNAEPEI